MRNSHHGIAAMQNPPRVVKLKRLLRRLNVSSNRTFQKSCSMNGRPNSSTCAAVARRGLKGFERLPRQALNGDLRCDVLVVGAGITGSLAAEHLTRLGHDVVVIDRERPGYGSTAASTAMLLWEIDRSLAELANIYGFDRAAGIYRRSLEASRGIIALVHGLQIDCDLRQDHALYIASAETGEDELRQEHALRRRAGLPGRLLDHAGLREEFGIVREAALLSPDVAEADPLRLAQGLLQVAVAQGARVFEAEAVGYDCAGRSRRRPAR